MPTVRYFVLDIDQPADAPIFEGFGGGAGLTTRALGGARGPGIGAPRPRALPESGRSARSLKVTAAELSPGDVAIERKAKGRTLERAFPLRLIAPKANGGVAPANAGNASWGIAATMADKSQLDGSGVTVAVLDTGIVGNHPAFAHMGDDRLIVEDFTVAGGKGMDGHGHGSHCAGTIFGADVNGTRIGIARNIDRALVGKVLPDDGSGDSAMLFEALQWASREGANIVSMSLGFDFPGMVAQLTEEGMPPDVAASNALVLFTRNLRGFDRLMSFFSASADMLVFAAAGNESRADAIPSYLITASLPAAADQIVPVGAFGRDGQGYAMAPFSNTDVRIAAPGVDIVSANHKGGLATMSGTSQACPHIAGLAALHWQKLGNGANAADVLAELYRAATAYKLPAGTDPARYGRGRALAPMSE